MREPETSTATDNTVLPFWFWNGKMEPEEMRRQIAEMAAQKVGGFMICARQGLEIPYLSAAWFERVRLSLTEARRHGLQVWIYDEYPYPSGMAGGEIALRHPEARHKTLEHLCVAVEGARPVRQELGTGRILDVRAVPVSAEGIRQWNDAIDLCPQVGILQRRPVFQQTGLTAYNRKRFFTAEPVRVLQWDAPDGAWEIHLFAEEEICDFKYYGCYMDPCNEAAVRSFIELTHERYAREVGEFFGGTIRGFFTDETGFLGRMPWSPSLPDFFKEQNGYDLIAHLSALFCRDANQAARVRYDYFQTLHLLLRERYHKPIGEWCRRHGLQYVSEVPLLRASTMRYSDIPASDSGHEKLGVPLKTLLRKNATHFRYNPMVAAAVSNQLDRPGALVECFHSVGWSMTLQDAKWMFDRFLAMGISRFNLHAFFYTTDDLRKHDAPPSQFFQNPYWTHFHHLTAYGERMTTRLAQGRPTAGMAVLDPTATLWAHLANPIDGFSYAGEDLDEERELNQLKEDWIALTTGLQIRMRPFEPLDPELLQQAKIADGEIRLGRSVYRVLLLPSVTALEADAWEKIKAFAECGGTVVACGRLPDGDIGPAGAEPEEVVRFFGPDGPQGAVQVARQSAPDALLDEVLRIADSFAPPAVRLQAASCRESFLAQIRDCGDDGWMVFVANQEGQADRVHITGVAEDGVDYACRIIDPESECEKPLAVQVGDGCWSLTLPVGPYEARLLRIFVDTPTVVEKNEPVCLMLPLDGDWAMTLQSENMLRLGRFNLFIGDELLAEQIEAKPFINMCQEVRPHVPLQYDQVFGTPVAVRPAYPLEGRLETVFSVARLPRTCRLKLEEHTLCGNFCVWLNGQAIALEDGLSAELGPLLREGENRLVFSGVFAADEDGLTDAVWLYGKFGVDLSGAVPSIGPLPQMSGLAGLDPAGCPHYAGEVVLRRRVRLAEVPESGPVRLVPDSFPPQFHQTAELTVNGHALGVRPWMPYCWECDASVLKAGTENEIELRLVCGLDGSFDGTRFNNAAGDNE